MRREYFYIFLVCVIAAVLFIFNTRFSDDTEPFSSFSAAPEGCSLFYDTLLRMGYSVSRSYIPIGDLSAADDVYILIQPENPRPGSDDVEKIMEWVKRGGRLVYLAGDWNRGEIFAFLRLNAKLISDTEGGLIFFRYGFGEIVTGEADIITNKYLMRNSNTGALLQAALDGWRAGNLLFAEYYHGYHAEQNFFGGLPLAVKLTAEQAVIIALAYIAYKGKRFGNIIPYYEETERDENEYVKALARLYSKYTERR